MEKDQNGIKILLNKMSNNFRVNGYNDSLVLVSRKERTELLKTGLTGKDIESLYLKFNDITVIGIDWQDLNPKEPS